MDSVRTLDTTTDARRRQLDIHRRLTGPERVRLAVEMSDDAREIAAAGVRHRHPDWSQERVRREVLIRIYGAELVDRAWGPVADG